MAKNNFPIIKKLSDIEHAIDEKFFLKALRPDGTTIINYLVASTEAFPEIEEYGDIAHIRREFRGLVFDKHGWVIRRPFHKFFNIGERTETQFANLDVTQSHEILKKLDGSMIAYYEVDGEPVWGTKMGDTDFAKEVADYVKLEPRGIDYSNRASWLFGTGITPIFEWMSPTNRIVLDYGREPSLVLTALRDIRTGEYLSSISSYVPDNWPVVSPMRVEALSQGFLDKVKVLEGEEGFVARFTNTGQMVKGKTDWYVALHRVKSDLEFERGVVRLIIENGMDDLKPLMKVEDLKDVEDYENALMNSLNGALDDILWFKSMIIKDGVDRKMFALAHGKKLEPYERSILFKCYDEGMETVKDDFISNLLTETLLKQTNKNVVFDRFRKTKVFDGVPKWRGI